MAQLEAGDITQAVIGRMAECNDERFKTVMTALVKHAHAFLREVEPSEAEWIGAIEFLTATGKKCDDKRQEFILLSDVLGASMQTITVNNPAAGDATEATVLGPFFVQDSPGIELGGDVSDSLDAPDTAGDLEEDPLVGRGPRDQEPLRIGRPDRKSVV